MANEASGLDLEPDPLVDEGSEPGMGVELSLDFFEILLAHELGAALALMGVAELVVGAVALRGIGFAAAARASADIVLASDRSGTQRAE